MDLHHHLAIAEEAADSARRVFIEGLGSAPALFKSSSDFATDVDIELEDLIREHLREASGIPVFGEEEGGILRGDATWVVDPIDGTANYSSGSPNCAILISLVVDKQPVVAVTDIPLLGMRLTAIDGAPVTLNGRVLPSVNSIEAFSRQVGLGAVGSDESHKIPPDMRLQLLRRLEQTNMRPRISGSVGIDLAFVAQGIYEAAVSFSPHPWDNTAGVLLARSAGAVVTDWEGEPWNLESVGVVAGCPTAHAKVLDSIREIERLSRGAGTPPR
ncbi:inositol monophosphatase [Corynebacterium aquatimens]|nr:inositol monophosphatase [Corynebacterium aquatimens]WJY65543.1 Inositol-1-monophosphatase ImpA [Corynebacterium aquatimens]